MVLARWIINGWKNSRNGWPSSSHYLPLGTASILCGYISLKQQKGAVHCEAVWYINRLDDGDDSTEKKITDIAGPDSL